MIRARPRHRRSIDACFVANTNWRPVYTIENRSRFRSGVIEMRTTEQTIDEILDLAAVHFKTSREQLSPDDDFFKKLGIDSLQALELLTRLENHFSIELPDYEVQGVSDFRTLAERIQARL
jgi:acyl carrier protein